VRWWQSSYKPQASTEWLLTLETHQPLCSAPLPAIAWLITYPPSSGHVRRSITTTSHPSFAPVHIRLNIHNAVATASYRVSAATNGAGRQEVYRRPFQRLPRQNCLWPAEARRSYVYAIDQGPAGLLGSRLTYGTRCTIRMPAVPGIPA
jgi:hypothetical protein